MNYVALFIMLGFMKATEINQFRINDIVTLDVKDISAIKIYCTDKNGLFVSTLNKETETWNNPVPLRHAGFKDAAPVFRQNVGKAVDTDGTIEIQPLKHSTEELYTTFRINGITYDSKATNPNLDNETGEDKNTATESKDEKSETNEEEDEDKKNKQKGKKKGENCARSLQMTGAILALGIIGNLMIWEFVNKWTFCITIHIFI